MDLNRQCLNIDSTVVFDPLIYTQILVMKDLLENLNALNLVKNELERYFTLLISCACSLAP